MTKHTLAQVEKDILLCDKTIHVWWPFTSIKDSGFCEVVEEKRNRRAKATDSAEA